MARGCSQGRGGSGHPRRTPIGSPLRQLRGTRRGYRPPRGCFEVLRGSRPPGDCFEILRGGLFGCDLPPHPLRKQSKALLPYATYNQEGGEELPYSDSKFGRIRCPRFAE
jgi:hypothetical protein